MSDSPYPAPTVAAPPYESSRSATLPPSYSKPRDVLPSYVPSLQLHGLALLKTEFVSPYTASKDRAWKPVVLELNLTQLNMYEVDMERKCLDVILALYNDVNMVLTTTTGVDDLDSDEDGEVGVADLNSSQQYAYSQTRVGKLKHKHKQSKLARKLHALPRYYNELKDNNMLFEPEYTALHPHRGRLLHSYTLSNMQAGLAPSVGSDDEQVLAHIRYKNTLRVRVEFQQILLQMWSFHGMVEWCRALHIGKDLSEPLDLRRETRTKTIPGRNNIDILLASEAEQPPRDYKEGPINEPMGCCQRVRAASHGSISSVESSDLLFSRRASVSTTDSSQHCRDSVVGCVRTADTVSKHRFYRLEDWTPEAEKQFIASCVPKLQSFEKWVGREATISGYSSFLGKKQHANDPELLIESNVLEKMPRGGRGECRRFLVHEKGFVSVLS